MALHHSSLSVCTFNCRSVKNCLPEIHKLCDTHYFILLQEHWLLPFELNTLNNILPGCLFHGLSAVGVTSDVLSGWPYRGTAILYRKEFASCVKIISSSQEPRICGMQIDTNVGPLLLLCVYMPTNYGDDSSQNEFQRQTISFERCYLGCYSSSQIAYCMSFCCIVQK